MLHAASIVMHLIWDLQKSLLGVIAARNYKQIVYYAVNLAFATFLNMKLNNNSSNNNNNNKSPATIFFPLAFGTFGSINQAGCDFLSSLGRRLTLVSDDPREFSFLFQCLSIYIQRFNSVCFCNSFGNLPAQFSDQPRRT